jgi:Transposase domain (DUF772)
VGEIYRAPSTSSVAAATDPTCLEVIGESCLRNRLRLLLIGSFEGLDSERGMAWRAADWLGLRNFLGVELHEQAPDHSTISRTRRLIVGVAGRKGSAEGQDDRYRCHNIEWMRRCRRQLRVPDPKLFLPSLLLSSGRLMRSYPQRTVCQ